VLPNVRSGFGLGSHDLGEPLVLVEAGYKANEEEAEPRVLVVDRGGPPIAAVTAQRALIEGVRATTRWLGVGDR
jgi:hypothetical protein